MPFKNNNAVYGLGENDEFQVGVSNVDGKAPVIEQGVLLPWPSDPLASWVYYDCTIEMMLDSGIAVHNHLPQIDNTPDSLSSCLLDNPKIETIAGPGVNLRSNDQYADVVQRMGHSRYWFRLSGQALRVGLQVPIPGIKLIGGVPAIPYDRNPQWAYNRISPGGNYGGVILWHAAWSLWYTTAVPPRSNKFPAANPGAHISVDGKNVTNPDGMQSPYSRPDGNATLTPPSLYLSQLITKKAGK